jgi:hypothetical protein
MSEILVEDGATYPASVTVPEDGDARNAASVVVGFQALANRLAHIMLKMGAWILGGTITPADDVTVHLSGGPLTFTGIDDYNVIIGAGTKFSPSGRIGNHCFDGDGGIGRANRRIDVIAPAAGPTDLDPTQHDVVYATPSATAVLRISPTPSVAYVRGDHIKVHKNGISFTLELTNPSGGTLGTIDAALGNGWIEAIYDGTTWRQGENRTQV